MDIPALLYGASREIKSRVRKVITALKRGVPWHEAIGGNQMLDTAKQEGLIVLDGPSSLASEERHFHCYALLSVIEQDLYKGAVSSEFAREAFQASLESAWGLLGLFGRNQAIWVTPEERRRPFLDATQRFWDQMWAEGERYTSGSTTGENIWSIPSGLHYVLANMGVSKDTLKAPLPAGGLPAVIAQAK